VYYLNLPKKWIAGGVYDPVADEVIEGATITVTDTADGTKRTAETDGFGDFRVEGLETAEYSLTVEAEGFRKATIASIRTDKDVNLGTSPWSGGGKDMSTDHLPGETSVNKTLCFMGIGTDCNAVMIDVKDDKVIRIRRFYYDSKTRWKRSNRGEWRPGASRSTRR
jgi:hypothetical protein